MKKKLVGLMLAIVFAVTLLPMAAFATSVNTVLSISTVDDLMHFQEDIESDPDAYKNQTVNFAENAVFDLAGKNWTPINCSYLTVNGNGSTIKNMTTTFGTNTQYAGFFGEASCSTITGLNFENAVVQSNHYAAVVVAHGLCTNISNCTVKNSTVTTGTYNHDNGDKAGAICGYLSGESTAVVEECTATGNSITGYRDIGGLVGYANGTATVQNNLVKDTVVCCDNTDNYKNYNSFSEHDINPVIGEKVSQVTGDNNVFDIDSVCLKCVNGVAKIGDQEYLYLADAFSAARAGDTVELLVDQIDSISGIPEGVTIKGKTGMTMLTGNYSGDVGQISGTLKDVTLKNLKFAGDGNALRYCYAKGNKVVIENCEFDCADRYGIHFDGLEADLLVKNCTVKGSVAISATTNNITFEGCTFAGRSRTSEHCNMNFYSDVTFNNCTFSEAYANGSSRGILMLNDNVVVKLNNCSLSNSDSTYTLTDVLRRDYLTYGLINCQYDGNGKLVSGNLVVKAGNDPGTVVNVVEGYKFVKVRTETGTNPAEFYIVGSEQGKTIVAPKAPEIKVSSGVKAEDQEVVANAAKVTQVVGITEALKEDCKNALLAAAKSTSGSTITYTKLSQATKVLYEIGAKVEAKVSDKPTDPKGTLTFEIKPVATISTIKDGDTTGKAENVPIDNSYLNGTPIKVTVGCGEIVPVQVAHISDDQSIEVFTKGDAASYANKTFAYDDVNKAVTIEITHFSQVEVLGTEKYTISNNGTAVTKTPNTGITANNSTTYIAAGLILLAVFAFAGYMVWKKRSANIEAK